MYVSGGLSLLQPIYFMCFYLFVFSLTLYKSRKSTIVIKPNKVRLTPGINIYMATYLYELYGQNNLWIIKKIVDYGGNCAAAFTFCRKCRDCTQIVSQQSGEWGNVAHALILMSDSERVNCF